MSVLLPGATIGVLGGGQLGRMMALAARRMGYKIVVLDSSAECPAGQIASDVVVASWSDAKAAVELAKRADVVTLETEHIPADVLDEVARHTVLRPGASVFRTIQDRAVQKQFLDSLSIAQANWLSVNSAAELAEAVQQRGELIVKARRHGYDGKGQARLQSPADADAAWQKIGAVPAVVEAIVPFVRELSVVMARGVAGDVAVYALAHNVHQHHVLHTTVAPANAAQVTCDQAVALATTIAHALDHIGVLTVECFELADGSLLVNEIAPRTHNSGHYTYGACVTSQFEQHVRAVCGLPLGDPTQLVPAVMVNLLGDLWARGEPAWQHVLQRPNARLHLYGKAKPAPGRKMGHVVLLGNDVERELADVDAWLRALGNA